VETAQFVNVPGGDRLESGVPDVAGCLRVDGRQLFVADQATEEVPPPERRVVVLEIAVTKMPSTRSGSRESTYRVSSMTVRQRWALATANTLTKGAARAADAEVLERLLEHLFHHLHREVSLPGQAVVTQVRMPPLMPHGGVNRRYSGLSKPVSGPRGAVSKTVTSPVLWRPPSCRTS
jgi:hypothetical protein